MSDPDIEVVFHHGGKFVNDGSFRYHGGYTSTLMLDTDKWSYFEILAILKEMGYRNVKEVWYSLGGSVLEVRLELLSDDICAMHVVSIVILNGQAHLFVVHMVSEPDYIHMLQYHGQGEDDDDEVGEEGEGKVCEHGEEGEEEVVEDGGGEVANVGEHKSDEVDEVGEDAEGKLSKHGEDKVGEDGLEELAEDGDKVAEVGEHDEDEVDDVGEDGEGDDGVCYEGDGEDDIIGGGVGDGEDDVGGGVGDGQNDVGGSVGDGQDEFDVSSLIGSNQDASINEDDFEDVRVHGNEQPQEEHCDGSLFVEMGTRSTPKKHVQARGLSDSE
ncbi:hypothetical protein LR48_Vigan10g088500 [Vigna angularis]|uniref:PB1-like domain-containing protein n=1 Tax=Phaseolus angularis TaxID=3914 RepID=A0A0L9VJ51_PHAAN|nr:hypothetical protein LR48_Vigan10g088500 [Vigna angularis]